MNHSGSGSFCYRVRADETGRRLDVLLAARLDGPSRSAIAGAIRSGVVLVGGQPRKPGYTVKPGDVISGTLLQPPRSDVEPEPIALDILYQDAALLVVNKPAGMVVHPSPGHDSGTLVNALLYHFPDLEQYGDEEPLRPGIVHRLDKDTTGCIVIAKTGRAHLRLMEQFKERRIRKTYLALVIGRISADTGRIDLPVGRHPRDRKKMSVFSHRGRRALTEWKVRRRFDGATLLELDLKTGRTHQIRVHLASSGHPVVGDPLYGGGGKRLAGTPMQNTHRQMLHAWRLAFSHPLSGQSVSVEAPLPPDMQELLSALGSRLTVDGHF
jgi:23S rRNA pseudouridine1911/1915/1917 synthase